MQNPELDGRGHKDATFLAAYPLGDTSRELVAVSRDYKVRMSNKAFLVVLALALGLIAMIAATWGTSTIFARHPYASSITPRHTSRDALSEIETEPQSTSPTTAPR